MPIVNPLPAQTSEASRTCTNSVLTLTQYPGTLPIKLRANAAEIQVISQPIRWTIDGNTPVGGSVGMYAPANNTIILDNWDQLKAFKAIRDGAVDATLLITYGLGYRPD